MFRKYYPNLIKLIFICIYIVLFYNNLTLGKKSYNLNQTLYGKGLLKIKLFLRNLNKDQFISIEKMKFNFLQIIHILLFLIAAFIKYFFF